MWSLDVGVEILEMSEKLHLVKCSSERDRERILEGGPWVFMGQVVLVQKWMEGLSLAEYVFDKIMLWVQMYNLPPELFRKEVAEEVAGKIGRLVSYGAGGVISGSKRKFLRVRVELDIQEELRPGFVLNRRAKEPLWIEFKYEKLPMLCYKCGKVGHEEKRCSNSESISAGRFGPFMRAEVGMIGPGSRKMFERSSSVSDRGCSSSPDPPQVESSGEDTLGLEKRIEESTVGYPKSASLAPKLGLEGSRWESRGNDVVLGTVVQSQDKAAVVDESFMGMKKRKLGRIIGPKVLGDGLRRGQKHEDGWAKGGGMWAGLRDSDVEGVVECVVSGENYEIEQDAARMEVEQVDGVSITEKAAGAESQSQPKP